jgi:cbb3-type cytochrome oxidase maturation protein
MDTLLFMLPFMVAVGGAFVAMFLWAIRTGQYDDLEGEKHRIFFEPDPAPVGPQACPEAPTDDSRCALPGEKVSPP